MAALTAKALSGAGLLGNASDDEKRRWNDALNHQIKKTILFEAERKKLIAFMEQNKIWYMLLKGAVIGRLYPHYGTREFADNDILFDENFRDTMREYMLKNGTWTRKPGLPTS